MKDTIIYNRTSTEEQNPENQLEDCKEVIKRLNIFEFEIIEEKQSAWKDDFKRDKFNELKLQIKKREVKKLIVWDLDRIYRNRIKLIAFFKYCKTYGCKIFSFRQQFLEDINNAPEPWNEMLFDNMIFILGWMAEEESSKKSERIRASLTKDKTGQTISKYGKIWGRKKVPIKTLRKITELHEQGKTYREISNEIYYWDINNHKKYVSIRLVHKTIVEFKRNKLAFKGSS